MINNATITLPTYRDCRLLDQVATLSGIDIYVTSMDSHSSQLATSENRGKPQLLGKVARVTKQFMEHLPVEVRGRLQYQHPYPGHKVSYHLKLLFRQ